MVLHKFYATSFPKLCNSCQDISFSTLLDFLFVFKNFFINYLAAPRRPPQLLPCLKFDLSLPKNISGIEVQTF